MEELTIAAIVLRLVTGVVIGFTIGMTGIGGGVLVLPVLTLMFGLPASLSVGTANFYAAITQAMAAIRHYKLKNINFSAGSLVLAGGIPSAITTAFVLNKHAASLKDNAEALERYEYSRQLFIAVIITLSATLLIWNLAHKIKRGKKPAPEEYTKIPAHKIPGALLVGITIGFLIAATSVGGGVITIPLLILAFKLPAVRSVGTSSLITLFLTATTAIVYGRSGLLDIPTAGIMAAGSILGVSIGSKAAVKLPEKILQGVIVALVLIAAVAMFLKGRPL